jgi:hypothetical protein
MAFHSTPQVQPWSGQKNCGHDAGKVNKLTLTIDRPKLSSEDLRKLMETQRNNHVSE